MRKISLFLVFIFLFVQISCAQNKNISRVSLQNQNYYFSLNSEYKYKVDPKGKMALGYEKTGKTYQGSELIYQYPYLYTQDRKTVYDIRQVERVIETTDHTIGRQTGRGTLIGLGAGALVGSVLLMLAFTDDGSGCEDPGECRGLSALAGMVGFAGSLGLGAGIGALVGALTKKKEKKIYVP